MTLDRAITLRTGAVLVAAATFLGSGAYVTAHPKNDAAPLQPPAVTQVAVRTAAPSVTASPARPPRASPPPRITIAPGVQATQLPGITFTHVS